MSWQLPLPLLETQENEYPDDGRSMSLSKQPRTKVATAKGKFLATHSGQEVARSVRVSELKRMVAEGRYEVKPAQLAVRILARALRRDT